MQRQDAEVARQNAIYRKIGGAVPKEATKIELLTKCLIEGIDY